MAQLFSFLKRKQIADTKTAKPAPGTSIYYDPELIGKLKHDHQRLLTTFSHIQQALADSDYPGLTKHLVSFRSELQDHLLTENVRLYVYLTHQLASNESNLELISSFRREMNDIGRTVVDFLRRYTDTAVDAHSADRFRQELDAIGEALVGRIQREERSLYPLYMDSR